MNSHRYHVGITWENGRKGLIFSPEVSTPPFDGGCIEVGTPPQFPGGISGIWSPEHLLVAAVSSCFMTTFLAIAENSKLEFVSFTCRAEGKLELVKGSWIMTEVVLHPRVTITGEGQRARAGSVVQRAEKACLISNSIKSKVIVYPVVEIAERLSVLTGR